jgi:DNA invertase Pin-like site-specific DNA recombinase
MKPYVAYYWPSVSKYGDVHADLAAQRVAVGRFLEYNGGHVASEHTEGDSSWRSTWPKLAEAIARAKEVQGTLVIGKLDRLVHNAAFARRLMDSRVEFVCCDNHLVNNLTVHVFAALADKDTERNSARTKAALIAAKARGVKLGSAREGHWEGREDRRRAGIRKGQPKAAKAAAEARSTKAREAYSGLMPGIIGMRKEGLTMAQIAEKVNAEGHLTRAGKPFSASMIVRLLQRAGASQPQPPAPPTLPVADYSDPSLLRLCPDPAGTAAN